MTAFLGPTLAVCGLAALGWMLDRGLSLRLAAAGAACWPLRVFCALSALYLLSLHPAALLLGIGGALLAHRGSRLPIDPEAPERRAAAWAIPLMIVCLVLAAPRPLVPVTWDEFGWLGKARTETQGWGSLRSANLDPGRPLFGGAYPLFWPLSLARLSLLHAGLHELVAAGAWLVALTTGLFAATLHAACAIGRPRTAPPGALLGLGLLLLTPFVLVHLRLAYVDLSTGLMAAIVVLSLAAWAESRNVGARWPVAAIAIPALVLTGLKDEGPVWTVAIAVAFAVTHRDGRSLRLLTSGVVIPALGAAMLWKLITHAHGVVNPERIPTLPVGRRVVPLLVHGFLPHAGDLTTWGAYWGVIGGAVVATFLWTRRFSRATRFAAGAFTAQALAAYAVLLISPEPVFHNALWGGYILNRVLLQLLPVGAVVVSLVAVDVVASPRPAPGA